LSIGRVRSGQRTGSAATTREQVIILGFIAGAFVAGWLTRALTELRTRPARDAPDRSPPPSARLGRAVGDSRRELERAIRAYHAAVSSTLENGGTGAPGESKLENLARALAAFATAVDRASAELGEDEPLAARLRASALELHELSLDLLLHPRGEELPIVFDELEQNLISAASVILPFTRRQPQPA
jgi:hypothetical protein